MAGTNIKDLKTLTTLIYKLSNQYKTRVFFVGGPVRDFILSGRKKLDAIQDLDLAVEKNYHQIGTALARKLNVKITHHPMFMTMTLYLPHHTHLDIAQTRLELYAKPAVLPKVKSAGINHDLARRDFTINAMAMLISQKPPYVILDPYQGRQDLKLKIIRILHPKSFIDDPTRIFRAIRFATRFGFQIEKNTLRLMRAAIKSSYLKLLTPERVLYEFKMIMLEQKSAQIIKKLPELGIIRNLYQVKLPDRFFSEHKHLTTDQKLIHLFAYLPYQKWVKYPLKKEVAQSARAIQQFTKFRKKLLKANKPSAVCKILKPISQIALEVLAQTETKPVKEKIKLFLNKYSQVKIFTTGKDLKALGIKPGKKYSTIFNTLLQMKLDGIIKNRNDELKYIRKIKNA